MSPDPMQDYKSVHAAVMICYTLVNILTHRHRPWGIQAGLRRLTGGFCATGWW